VQILLNLVSNAAKFTPTGGNILVDAVRDAREPTKFAQIRVRDTGRGVPAEDLERIFEPFVQLGRSMTSGQGGVGLGLAISRELAQAMGGQLYAQPQAERGATFVLRLPTA
jgi:signal transduction histidine kinase